MKTHDIAVTATILLVMVALLNGPQSAMANGLRATASIGPNTETEVRPDLGPKMEGMVPGVNGYKVFGPGAIWAIPIQTETAKLMWGGPRSVLIYRSGSTDAWWSWRGPFQPYDYWGSHTSDSDLFETDIWADGYIRESWRTVGWRDDCHDRTTGTRAWCQSTFDDTWMTAYAETQHHFHTSGYVDSNFTTADYS